MKANFRSLCLFALLLAAPPSSASAQSLINPGFEQMYLPIAPNGQPVPDSARITGSIAPGWSDNTDWAKNVILAYGSDTNRPHSGAACQRITVTQGFAQITQGMQFAAGRIQASVWVRAEPAQWVSLTVRLAGAPYTAYGARPIKAGPKWTQIRVECTVPATSGGLYVNTSGIGTVWLDDAGIAAVTSASQKLSPPAGAIPRSYFGMNVNNMHVAPEFKWPVLDFGTYRSWDSGVIWPTIETARGVYDWSNLDKDVAQAQAHHAQFIFTLGQTPTWASSHPEEPAVYGKGYAAPPANLSDWKDFVGEVAARYKGRIAAYEVWNEPDIAMFYTGTPAQLAALETAAAEVVHHADPKALIVAPAVSGGGAASQLRFLDDYLTAGGGVHADVLAYHGYVYPAEEEVWAVQSYRDLLQSHGVGDKPLWNTETGTELATVSETETAAFVSRELILDWALGLGRICIYAYNGSFTGLDAPTSDPKKRDPSRLGLSGIAYAQSMTWLSGAKMLSCAADAHGTWVCALRQPDGTAAWLVWNPQGPSTFRLPLAWKVRRRTGGSISIGIQPVLVSRTK